MSFLMSICSCYLLIHLDLQILLIIFLLESFHNIYHRENIRRLFDTMPCILGFKGTYSATRPDFLIRCCVCEDEIYDILKACHDKPCGVHFTDKITANRVLQLGYYWPTSFRDVERYVHNCNVSMDGKTCINR